MSEKEVVGYMYEHDGMIHEGKYRHIIVHKEDRWPECKEPWTESALIRSTDKPAVVVPCKKTVEMCARFLEGQRYMVLSPTETYSAAQHTQKLKHSVNNLADLMRRTIVTPHSQQSAEVEAQGDDMGGEALSATKIHWDEFESWWRDHGQYIRAGGGQYEKTFAWKAWNWAIYQNNRKCDRCPSHESEQHNQQTEGSKYDQFQSSRRRNLQRD